MSNVSQHMSPAELKKPILAHVQSLLRPVGYRRAGSVFSRTSEDLVHLVEVQSSRSNTDLEARFTVNIGIFAPAVVYADVRDTTRPSIPGAHWRRRLGSLSLEKKDLWWSARTRAEAETVAHDITDCLALNALRALAELPNLQALAAVWKSGNSPGITEHQRMDFLARLRSAEGRQSVG